MEMWIDCGLNQAGNDVQQQPDGTINLYQAIVDLVFHVIIIASIMTIGIDKASAALSGAMPIGFWSEGLLAAELASLDNPAAAHKMLPMSVSIFSRG